jgi:hypothetical protein
MRTVSMCRSLIRGDSFLLEDIQDEGARSSVISDHVSSRHPHTSHTPQQMNLSAQACDLDRFLFDFFGLFT